MDKETKNENINNELIESENGAHEEKPLTREDYFKALEIVSGTEDDE